MINTTKERKRNRGMSRKITEIIRKGSWGKNKIEIKQERDKKVKMKEAQQK